MAMTSIPTLLLVAPLSLIQSSEAKAFPRESEGTSRRRIGKKHEENVAVLSSLLSCFGLFSGLIYLLARETILRVF